MPKYLIECATGFCGVDDLFVVEADDELEAEEMAYAYWMEILDPSAICKEEISEESIEENLYYEIS